MKKRIMGILLAATVISTMLAGCGNGKEEDQPVAATPEPEKEIMVDLPTATQSDTEASGDDQNGLKGESENTIEQTMFEKLNRLVEAYTEFVSNDSSVHNRLVVDNAEHWTFYNEESDEMPTYKDGSQTLDDYNVYTVAACNQLDEYVNKGMEMDQTSDYLTFLGQFENEAAVISEYNPGGDEQLMSCDVYMVGCLRYAATLASNGFSIGTVSTDGGTYEWNGHKSAYTVPILFGNGEEGAMAESGLIAIFDGNGDLMNLHYVGEGDDSSILVYTYSEMDAEERLKELEQNGETPIYNLPEG